ncbi:hypothetical protein FB451DRAFT_1285430 [Mycena latifolia]|nr:hypothetical protein FB451DRAFT_1285430 [Mycena latifolia]
MVHTIHPATSVSYRCDRAYCTSCGTYCASVSWCSPCTQCIGWLGAGATGTKVGFNLDKVADGGFSGFDKPCREGPTSGAVGCTFCAVTGGFSAIAPARLPPPPHSFSASDSTARWTFHLQVGNGLSSSVRSNTGTGFGHGARRFERRWWCCCTSAGSGWAPAFLLLHLRTHLRRLRRLLRLLWGSHILRHRSASEAVIMGWTIEEPDGRRLKGRNPAELYKGSCSLVHHFGGRRQAGDCQ